MWRSVGLGLVGVVVVVVAACGGESTTPRRVSSAGAGGSSAPAGAAGKGTAGGAQNNGGVNEGGAPSTPAAGEGGVVATVGGAGGEAGGSGGAEAGADAGVGGGGAGGAGGNAGAVGSAGEAGQGGQGPGVCGEASPSQLPSCSPNPDQGGASCRECLKAKCCSTWQECYGEQPRNACGYGASASDDGEMDCMLGCWYDNPDSGKPVEEVLGACERACATCSDFVTSPVHALLECALEECLNDCFN